MCPSRANSGIIILNFLHVKLLKISDITATLPFTVFDFMQKYRESFAVSELGRIYAQLPLKEMAEKIRLAFSQKGIFLCRKRGVIFWGIQGVFR